MMKRSHGTPDDRFFLHPAMGKRTVYFSLLSPLAFSREKDSREELLAEDATA